MNHNRLKRRLLAVARYDNRNMRLTRELAPSLAWGRLNERMLRLLNGNPIEFERGDQVWVLHQPLGRFRTPWTPRRPWESINREEWGE